VSIGHGWDRHTEFYLSGVAFLESISFVLETVWVAFLPSCHGMAIPIFLLYFFFYCMKSWLGILEGRLKWGWKGGGNSMMAGWMTEHLLASLGRGIVGVTLRTNFLFFSPWLDDRPTAWEHVQGSGRDIEGWYEMNGRRYSDRCRRRTI